MIIFILEQIINMTNTAMSRDNSSDHDDISEIQQKFTEMCSNLNIESSITEQAWDEFKRIHSNVTLEVNIFHFCYEFYLFL